MQLRQLPSLVARAVILLALGAGPADAQLRVQTYVSGLASPVGFVQDPSNAALQYVVEQGGRVRIVRDGVLLSAPFLDISDPSILAGGGERGLLGLAFPPSYGASGRFYIFYTRASDGALVVARYRRSAANPLSADPASGLRLVWSTGLDHIPHPGASNHNGGCMAFGADGMLYVATGDGGGAGDPGNNAQNTSSLLGKILRVDVSSVTDTHPTGFVVPAGNPGLPRPEIWSYGWRNPWRFSFDLGAGGTGAMIVGDVGQGAREEVDYERAGQAGRNYGWRYMEGSLPYAGSAPAGLAPPAFDYDRTAGRSITGGYIYRGALFPELQGRYIFGDYVTRRIWSLAINPTTGVARPEDLVEHTGELAAATPLGGISSFGVDARGEMYVVDHTGGLILRFTRANPRPPTNVRIIR